MTCTSTVSKPSPHSIIAPSQIVKTWHTVFLGMHCTDQKPQTTEQVSLRVFVVRFSFPVLSHHQSPKKFSELSNFIYSPDVQSKMLSDTTRVICKCLNHVFFRLRFCERLSVFWLYFHGADHVQRVVYIH